MTATQGRAAMEKKTRRLAQPPEELVKLLGSIHFDSARLSSFMIYDVRRSIRQPGESNQGARSKSKLNMVVACRCTTGTSATCAALAKASNAESVEHWAHPQSLSTRQAAYASAASKV